MLHHSKHVLSLSGTWQFRQDGEAAWQDISVPGCWENLGLPHDWEGPGWYRKRVTLPDAWREKPVRRLWLRFGAVSYACEVWVNGVSVGKHIGAWDSFAFEATDVLDAGESLDIHVRVIKPGGPTFPTKQTTAGFLPYVWGYLFGGIWQDVTLEMTGPKGLAEESDLPPSRSRVSVQGRTPLLDGKPFYPRMVLHWGWYPETLHCNPPVETARAELEKIRALGYNGVKCCLWVPPPAYLDLCDRLGMLVWLELPLWQPEMGGEQRQRVYEEYARIVKQTRHHRCIVLWTLGCELSASCPDDFLKRLYERVKQLTGSPLVRDNSGGGECYGGLLQEHADFYDYHFYCDLPFFRPTCDYFLPRWRPEQPWFFGEFCDADAFRDLAALKRLSLPPSPPDSAPADIEEADAKSSVPASADTEGMAAGATEGELPWWAVRDPGRNPQGARWDMNITGQWANMERYDLLGRREELLEGQRQQTRLHRKFILEQTRSYREMSGYVVTGLRDTPISISGMLDDFGEHRYAPHDFRRFNADTVLLLGWHRRRNWTAGGDRPSYIDPHCHRSGETLQPLLGISHYGAETKVREAWAELRPADGQANSAESTRPWVGEAAILQEAIGTRLAPGSIQQIGTWTVTLPEAKQMRRLLLRVRVVLEKGEIIQNEWPLWVMPRPDWESLPRWTAYDPEGKLLGLEQHGATWEYLSSLTGSGEAASQYARPRLGESKAGHLVASRWLPEMAEFARKGGRAFVFVEKGSGLPFTSCPFWREAMKLFEAHPLWRDFSHQGFTDLHFYGLGSDGALNPQALSARMPDAALRPVLRRVDARTFAVLDYATEAVFPGGGRLLLTTLRPHGGLGDQPDGLLRHHAGVQFLYAALKSLL